MNLIPLNHVLLFSLLLFVIGIFGVLTRRNAIGILISLEILINAINLNFVVFSRVHPLAGTAGQMTAFFIMALAAAGAAVGLAIVLAIYRSQRTVQTDEINLLKW